MVSSEAGDRNVAGRPWLAHSTTIAFILVVSIAVVGLDLSRTWQGRSRAIEQSQREVINLTWAASQHAEGVFRLVNILLADFVERAEADGVGTASLERLRKVMQQRVASQPLLEDLVLVDANGITVVDGRPVTPRIDLSDREYFQYLRAHPNVGPYFGSAVRSRLTGRLIFPVTQRVNNVDGSFAGIAIATIEVGYFLDFYATFRLGHDGVASLWRDDGALMVRQSRAVAKPATDRGPQGGTSIRYLFPKAERGTYEVTSRIDGITRIVSYRRLPGYPLVIAISLGKAEQLAGWWVDAAEHLLAAIVVTLLLGFVGIRLTTQVQRAAEADHANASAAAASNESLTRLSRHLARARDQAERANRAKSRFLAGMSHELRTPLNGILGYARLLRMEGGLSPSQDRRVDGMLVAGNHLLEMITCVLDLSQIEAGHLELRPVEFDVQAVAAACLDLIRPLAEAKRLTLTLTVTPGAPKTLFNDPGRLRQVLLNLLGNAAKFTSHGSIALRLRTTDASALRIEISDTGPGIPAEQRQRLFQDFERLDTEVTGKSEGAGLGLALSKGLVAMMGGRLDFHDNPGGGSVFWLELPCEMKAVLRTATDPVPGPVCIGQGPVPTRALKVLVADDVAMNRDIADSYLRASGHEVTCVEGGAEAVAAVADDDFDAVLMDVRMPEVDGLEATRRIRALGGPRGRVPIVALTAQVFTEQVAQCREAGMDSHLLKPYDPDMLLTALLHAIALARGEPVSVVPMPIGAAEAALIPIIGSDLMVFDQAAFARTASYLTTETVTSHLRTISRLGDSLLLELIPDRIAARGANRLAEEAHVLAGTAGMFGFMRLAAMGRRFEHAVQSGLGDVPELVDGLRAALEVTLQEIKHRR